MGGLISIQRFPEDNFAAGYCVCFGISPFETLESYPCLPLPQNREIGIYKRIPFLHPVPPKAKYLLAYPLLKAPVVVVGINSIIPGCHDTSVSSSSLSIVASKIAVWQYDKMKTLDYLLVLLKKVWLVFKMDCDRKPASTSSDIVTTKTKIMCT